MCLAANASSRLDAAIAAAAFVPTRQDLRNRAHLAIKRPIPKRVVDGGAAMSQDYKDAWALVYLFAMTGRRANHAAHALYRLEGMQGVRS